METLGLRKPGSLSIGGGGRGRCNPSFVRLAPHIGRMLDAAVDVSIFGMSCFKSLEGDFSKAFCLSAYVAGSSGKVENSLRWLTEPAKPTSA